jgi:hypothetical protein
MSIELYLARFDPSGGDAPKHPNVLQELVRVARCVTEKAGEADAVSVAADGASFDIELPGGTGTVHPTFAQIPIAELDALTLEAVFEIARAGDMVVITEGGTYPTILTSTAQRARLPRDWQDAKQAPVCDSVDQLKHLLQDWYAPHKQYAEQLSSDLKAGVTAAFECEILKMYRFDRSGNEIARHPDVMRDLVQVAEAHLGAIGQNIAIRIHGWRLEDLVHLGQKGVILRRDATELSIGFPLGSADVYPSSARFFLSDLDLPTARLLLEIARTGDMSIIIFDHGPLQVILTDPAQEARMPEEWIKQGVAPIVCRAAEHLLPLLKRKLQLNTPPGRRVRAPVDPFPSGSRPTVPRSIAYVEGKPNEKAGKHQDKLYKYVTQARKTRGPHCPKSGVLGSEFWRLETPAGQAFYAYDYNGDKENFLALIRDFAKSEGRAVGCIQNFDTFVQDDGRKLALSACKCTKVNADP